MQYAFWCADSLQAQELVGALQRRQKELAQARRGHEADAAVARFTTETQRALEGLLDEVRAPQPIGFSCLSSGLSCLTAASAFVDNCAHSNRNGLRLW